MNSPLCFPKMWSLFQLPTLLLQNAECFYKMCSLHELLTILLTLPKLPLCRVCLNSHSIFKKHRVQTNSPLCSPKMRSLFQLPILSLQNAESARTPHCAFKKCQVNSNSPLCFYNMCSPLEPHMVFFRQCRV